MPTQAFGVYAAEEDAGTEVSSTYEGRHVTLVESELLHPTHADSLVDKGDPVVFGTVAGNHGVGVAFKSAAANTDYIALDTEGIWNLSVTATDDAGNILVTGGDPLFINTTTCVISKIRNNVTQVPFGYALGQVASGATAVIAVKVHWDPRANWVLDDDPIVFGNGASDNGDITLTFDGTDLVMVPVVSDGPSMKFGDGTSLFDVDFVGTAAANYLRFDASADEMFLHGIALRIPEDEVLEFGAPDHIISFTGEEIDISGDRTTGGDADYYRCLHASGSATLGAADRWGTISCYTSLVGAAHTATWAFGGSFSLSQETRQVTGYLGAVQAEFKNAADNCSTACCLFCRLDNDSAVGFGGAMHSFIRFEDNSSATHCHVLFDMDTFGIGADNTEIFCTQNAWAITHTLRINVDGTDYWIGVSNAR